jgi:hypothetical protein
MSLVQSKQRVAELIASMWLSHRVESDAGNSSRRVKVTHTKLLDASSNQLIKRSLTSLIIKNMHNPANI